MSDIFFKSENQINFSDPILLIFFLQTFYRTYFLPYQGQLIILLNLKNQKILEIIFGTRAKVLLYNNPVKANSSPLRILFLSLPFSDKFISPLDFYFNVYINYSFNFIISFYLNPFLFNQRFSSIPQFFLMLLNLFF